MKQQPGKPIQPGSVMNRLRELKPGESITLEGRGRSMRAMAAKLVHARYTQRGDTVTRVE
jgi:carbon monoxide dehydrogenase subunit G